ncbi:MFS transporter [Streptomyces guryensis]|uniref:MFS transporter n=1 Tax=Streptomyces guryensis TaxID=2886947 RepID=A0A9Q3W0F8_9ACTN|nr:MFS transporter [Streptomyces guryensis]MCD9880641.1 MFS transporter [Streptomyces guryensis]
MSGQTPAPTAAAGFLQRRLGFPPLTGNRKLLGATAIDSLGNGLVLAFVLIYFTRTTSLSLTQVGAAISLARLLAVPTAVAAGPLIDRFGARRTALAGNVVSAVGYAGFLASQQAWHIVLVTWLTQVGFAMYWTSSTGLVGLATQPEWRPRWFAVMNMLRNSGLAAGGALGALLIDWAGTAGLRAVVVTNAASYVAAALLLALWRPANEPRGKARTHARPVTAAGGGYRAVLRDRRYLLLVGINLNFAFNILILSMLIAVYINTGLHQPAWIAGMLIMVNCLQVALTQTSVTRLLENRRPIHVVIAGALLSALSYVVFIAVHAASARGVVLAGLLVAVIVFGFAETTANPVRENLSVSLAPEELRGRYLAVYQLSYTFAQTAGPGLFAYLLTRGAALPWIFLITLNLLVVPFLLLLERMIRNPAAPNEAEPVPASVADRS